MTSRNRAAVEPEIPPLPPGTRLRVLDNGLTIILREDHSAPVVSAQAWCCAGSIHEGNWLGAGLSHVLEHMLFKGTSQRAPGQIDQQVQDAGGQMNAYTSFDRTVFWISVPNTGTAVAVDILCDIMQNATLPEEEMEKEKQVIRREMDMNQDDPGRRAGRRLFETAYTRSPYRYTIIGYPDIFDQITREDVCAYYREKYVPNNIFFVVTGHMDADQVEAQIREAYANTKARPLPPVVLPSEPQQAAPRELIEEAPIELAYLHFAWHIPDIRHPDVPALDVLSTLLGAGQSSRLYQSVRERQGVVHQADAWTYSPGNPGLFGMSAVVDAENFDSARAALLKEMELMRQEPVSDGELQKAIKQFSAATLASHKTMQGQAQDLGSNWMAASDLNFSERYLAADKRLTPEDLLRTARTYLTPENRTLYALLPTGCNPLKSIAKVVAHDRPVEKIELANGLRIVVKPDDRLPFVELRLLFQGGVLSESKEQNGITSLLSRMFLKGTTSRSAEQIVTEIESVGGHIDSYSGNNSLGISAEMLQEDFTKGLELLTDVILHPSFPEASLEREKAAQLAAIRGQRDQVLQTAARLARRELFGEKGYGLEILGTEASVTGLTVDALRSHYQKLIIPNNAVLAAFGHVDCDQVRDAANRFLGHWPQGTPVDLASSPPTPRESLAEIRERREKKQAVIVLCFPGATLNDPDRFPLELLQEALSDLGSRLFVRIREKLGLAYYVGAQNFLGLQPGYFAFYAGTAPEKIAQVQTELLEEAILLGKEGLTEEELRRAKAKLIGQRKIGRQDLGALAMTVALDELYGLGHANFESETRHYEEVTLEQVRAVSAKILQPQKAVAAMVLPEGADAASP